MDGSFLGFGEESKEAAPEEVAQLAQTFTLPPRYNPVLAKDYAKRFVSNARELEHRGNINATCVDDEAFYTCGDSHLRQWNTKTATCENQWKVKDGKSVMCLCSDSGWLWCGKRTGVVQGINTSTGEEKILSQSDDAVVAVASDGEIGVLWALSEEGLLLQHDIKSGSVIFRASLRQHARMRALNYEVSSAPQIELCGDELWVLWSGSIFSIDQESGAVTLAKKMPRRDGGGEDPVTAVSRVFNAR